ncbi:DUF4349 domain-containing protein [Longimicrobium terrae]|uniref:DUF4349 domain-containing protein n=1 Tax=Longimicrobium terrae TaxID=1639882 RepID=A0A841GXR8_9BACT|nr:DUF4349 domain-containing protein [Longimicrobium terrae]MBB4636156.1 hypothetical protein [Longimicrobium terrae]MBB6070551.1 hypothetical protein [Longimicrobium terrae]NNC29537.1 DUF4349 domain-containing protein [Longimicrobium terrae]
MRITPSLLPAALLLTLAACGASMEAAPPASGPLMLEELTVQPRGAQQRQVAQQAGLSLVANDLPAVARTADSMATALGGFVETSEMRGDDGLRMVLRVPAPSLDAALDRLASMGRVRQRSIRRQDVTAQATDLDARLTNLRTLRDRLRAHLSQSSAVGDLIQVERELARVQGEIDALEAAQRGLQGRVALSGIQLDAERPQVLGPLGLLLTGVASLIGKLFVIR